MPSSIGAADKNRRTTLKIEFLDALLEGMLELLDGLDVGVNSGEIGFKLLKLSSSASKGKWPSTCESSVFPERMRDDSGPPRDVAFAYLDNGFLNHSMLVFDIPFARESNCKLIRTNVHNTITTGEPIPAR